MRKNEETLNALVAKLRAVKPGYVFEAVIPVVAEERLLLQSCNTCFFNNSEVCDAIECWGKLSNIIFKVS